MSTRKALLVAFAVTALSPVCLGAAGFRFQDGDSTTPLPRESYAIVVSRETLRDAGWRGAVNALRSKYEGRVFPYDYPDLWSVQDAVAAYAPRYLCLVARPSEATRGFVKDSAAFARTLDDDPYEDAIWAILTGFDAADALRIATARPLEVSRGISHVGSGWLEWLDEGVSWNEGVKNTKYVKVAGENLREVAGPDDTTHEMVAELNTGRYDVMSSSGHATEHDWHLGYSYPDGTFVSRQGKLVGVACNGLEEGIVSPNPKVYYSPGNCLIAHAADMDSMVPAWIHSGGANQFFGHVTVQYRTCWAWEVAGYFFNLQGRFSFAESVFFFHQDVIARLEEGPDAETRSLLTSDRDATVLYGDPAWQARVKSCTEPLYEQALAIEELGDGKVRIDFTVKALRECAPAEPAATFLPIRLKDLSVSRTDAAGVIGADDFILMRLVKEGEKPLKPGETRSVSILARRSKGLERAPRPSRTTERMTAQFLDDLVPASSQPRPVVRVRRTPTTEGSPISGKQVADATGWWRVAPSGDLLTHVLKDGREDVRLALPGRDVSALAWDGRYVWLAEKGAVHVVAARGELLFSIPFPEIEEPVAISVKKDTLRLWGSRGDEVSCKIDRSIRVSLGPVRTAWLGFSAGLVDQGGAGLDVADVHIAAPWGSNRQDVVGRVVLSAPARLREDRWGQPFFSFHGLSIPPKVPFRCSIAWNARLREARYWIWPDRVGPIDSIPKAISRRYLVDSAVLGIGTPEIKQAVAEAVGKEKEPYWIARRIYHYVIEHVRFERGLDWSDAPTLLKRGVGTCSSYTYLFIAMCRAAGLPARFAAGIRYRGGNPSADREFHRWAEVYLPGYGWVPADPSGGDSDCPVARAMAFGRIPDTDFVMTVGGGDSEVLGWQYNALAEGDAEEFFQPSIVAEMEGVWTTPGMPGAERQGDGFPDGDFASGTLDEWRVEGPHVTEVVSSTRTGSGACLHIRVNPGQSCEGNVAAHPERWERAYRKVRLPNDAAFLHFCAKVTGAEWHEPVSVFADQGEGPEVIFSAGAGDGSATATDWGEQFVDVSRFRGMTIILGFFGANANGAEDHSTDLFVDDVYLCDKERNKIEVPRSEVTPPDARLKAHIEARIRSLRGSYAADRREVVESLIRIGLPARAMVEAATMAEDPATRLGAEEVLRALNELDFRLTDRERAENAALDSTRY